MRGLYRYIIIISVLISTNVALAETKVLVEKNFKIDKSIVAQKIADYDNYTLYQMSDNDAKSIKINSKSVSVLKNSNLILFDAKNIDTQKYKTSTEKKSVANDSLYVIQFIGPIKQDWLDLIKSKGAKLIHYVANNAYLIWAPVSTQNELNNLVSMNNVIQFSTRYDESFKKGKSIEARYHNSTQANETINVVVQLSDSPNLEQSKSLVSNLALGIESPWNKVMNFHTIRMQIQFSDIQEILNLPDSYWVGEYFERTLNDEIQNQILAADFIPDNSAPAMTGYADFLNAKGFPTNQTLYPIVDVTDGGIGNGTVNSNDPTFHEGGLLANPTRLAYVSNCTAAATGQGDGGHGHLNLNIVGGFESRVGFPYIDLDGYIRTQGVSPFTRLAGTRIFGPNFDLSACGGTETGLIQSVQNDGANIMNNSWGCSGCAGTYDDSSQAFDVGSRDADLGAAGNQELIVIFSAGNSGPGSGTIGTPGNGKNMITVGASENFRPIDEDGNWTDGCGVGPSGADNAMDIIDFSSRGPAPGNRIKPEVIAPGTHIHGTASTSPNYDGSGVCDQFRPGSQTVIAASSGTSHSAPAVAGVASLIYYWLETGNANTLPSGGMTPSPSLMKAYMMAHPTYLTGASANDTLPSNSQGYGMPNLDIMFDDSNKFLLNQSVVLDNTGETWSWVGSAADPSKPVRIAMAYTDQAGAVGTSPQVNNLDLMVTTNSNDYLGNNFTNNFSTIGGVVDAENNYEAVFFPAGTASDLSITVRATNIAGDGIPNSGDATDQDFSLVCYNCAQDPTFTINSTPSSIEVCSPDDAVYTLDIGSILGFVTPVTLSISGEPSGSSASFSVNPVTPGSGSQSVLTLGNIGSTTAGDYNMMVNGVAGIENKSKAISLSIFDGSPAMPVLTLPTNGAALVPIESVTFNWNALPMTTSYVIEIATDVSFNNIIHTESTTTNSVIVNAVLNSNTEYFWTVRGENICSGGPNSLIFSFTTAPLPGECPIGQDPIVLATYDFESGTQGWVSGTNLGADTWALSTSNPVSGSSLQHWHVDDQDVSTDTFITSPVITLPVDKSPLTFQFENYQEMEDNGSTACWDGGILEISINSGAFVQVDNSLLKTDPYDGVFSSTSNALNGQQGWCGDPQEYLNSIVDINAQAGDDVQFRFRISTDGTVGHPGWDIDDIKVQGCELASAPEITVTKTATLTTDTLYIGEADLNDVITFSVSVENTGDVALDTLVVNDTMGGALTCMPTALVPAEVATCTAYTYTVQQGDIDVGGTIDNTATATMTDPGDASTYMHSATTQTPINQALFKDGFE